MHFRKTAACALLALSLGACEGGGRQFSGETLGTIGGGAAGAVLGSQIGQGGGQVAATAIGTVLGALAGRELGRYFEGNDRDRAIDAEQTAISRGESITWTNPETGHRGTVSPQRSYRNQSGQLCREYAHTVYIEGRAETAEGTACRQEDGTWRLVS